MGHEILCKFIIDTFISFLAIVLKLLSIKQLSCKQIEPYNTNDFWIIFNNNSGFRKLFSSHIIRTELFRVNWGKTFQLKKGQLMYVSYAD